jgi:hypothetical protein
MKEVLMKTVNKMFGKSFKLLSICIVAVLIAAIFTVPVIAADSSEGGFHISQWTGDAWEEIYQHQFQVKYSEQAFSFDVVDGKVTLRITQVGTPFADIDQISLMVDGEELIPEYARYTGNGQSILEDILELDHNVVLTHEQEIEVSWDVPTVFDQVTVSLTANEYGTAFPFQFPGTGYATYKMGSNTGSITVDGLISETDGTAPLYAPFWRPSTGHPDGYTYIYVCDDEQYVYFSLDVTCDNTNEFGEDWAEIRILKSDGSEQAFRINDYDSTWGKGGFGLTGKVSCKHQTYEFAITKSIIGNEDLKFGLGYYGTAGVVGRASANADVDPLVIKIDGDPKSGQIFKVGDKINIEGFVHSIASAYVNSGQYLLETMLSCDLNLGPGGLGHDSYYDYKDNKGSPGTTSVNIEYNDKLSFQYTLTATGEYTITLNSSATADIKYLNSNPITGSLDNGVQTTLSFTVVGDETHTLTYSAETGGTISGATPQTVNDGGDGTTVTAVPNTGYHFVKWSDGSTDNPRTDYEVTDNIIVMANFAIDPLPPVPELPAGILLALGLAGIGAFIIIKRRKGAANSQVR